MRKFLLATSFILLTAAGYSQFVIFGAKAGLNLATVTGNDVDNTKLMPSFHVGALANFFINENFMVQPEVLFSGKGVKDDASSYKFNYINVPVVVQYKTNSGFFVETGPQVGFLISAKRKVNGNNSDFKEYIKSTDYSWVGGLGYKSAMGLGAGVRYDFGFFNIAKQGIIRNKALMVSVFYTFGSNTEQ